MDDVALHQKKRNMTDRMMVAADTKDGTRKKSVKKDLLFLSLLLSPALKFFLDNKKDANVSVCVVTIREKEKKNWFSLPLRCFYLWCDLFLVFLQQHSFADKTGSDSK